MVDNGDNEERRVSRQIQYQRNQNRLQQILPDVVWWRKRKVRIACSLALQDLVASRASKNIELFIGDEIDDALDTAGLERLMGILEAKARERGTVMIISHKEMKSWFRETITVEVKEGRSYVV